MLGVGPGRYGGAVAFSFGSPIYDELGADAPTRAVDDFWLHLVVEFGIAGVLAYLGIFASILLQLVHAVRHAPRGANLVLEIGTLAVAIGLATDSLTEMLLEGNTLSFPLWLLLGVASAVAAARAGTRAAVAPAREQSPG